MDNALICSMDERDYLATISATGTFAKASFDYIRQCKAHKVLVTVNRDQVLDEQYDRVYRLSSQDRSRDGKSVYATYGINYMFDVIYSIYTRRYQKEDSGRGQYDEIQRTGITDT